MSELIQPVVVLIVCILGWRLVTWRSEYGLAGVVTSRHQRCLEHTAEMECDLAMCEHAVDGEHPRLLRNKRGQQFWALENGVLWEVGKPCPIQESAPTADAN